MLSGESLLALLRISIVFDLAHHAHLTLKDIVPAAGEYISI